MAVQKVVLARPRGFCAGVEMAVETVERALDQYGPPLYVFHEIVHNRHVVEDLARRGVVFVPSVDEVPVGARMIFSAHGVSPVVRAQAKEKDLQFVIDATCPLVQKVHREVRRFAENGYWIILIGHADHDEIVGTSGEAPTQIQVVANVDEAERVEIPDPDKAVVLTQTTLSVDDAREIIAVLRERFPKMKTPAKEDICYATQNRQDAVKELAEAVDMVLVIGSNNSENSNQLCRVARSFGTPAHLVNGLAEINSQWLEGVETLGVTSGASVPERLVEETVASFQAAGAHVTSIGFEEENIRFALPGETR